MTQFKCNGRTQGTESKVTGVIPKRDVPEVAGASTFHYRPVTVVRCQRSYAKWGRLGRGTMTSLI